VLRHFSGGNHKQNLALKYYYR